MAGYITKHNSYMYQGEFVNGDVHSIPNGSLVVFNEDNNAFVLAGSDSSSSFIVVDDYEEIYNKYAIRVIVDKLNKPYYFVCNETDINDSSNYDYADYETAPGKFISAHPLSVGEEFVTTIYYGNPSKGNAIGVYGEGQIGGGASTT